MTPTGGGHMAQTSGRGRQKAGWLSGKGAHYLSSCRRTSQPLQAVVGPPAWLVFRGHGAQLSVPWAACSTISSCSPPGEPLARVPLIGRHGTRRIDSDAGQKRDRRPDNGIPQSARKGSRREEPKRGACSAPCHGRQAERRLRERWVGLADCGAGLRALRIERFSAQNLSGACAKLCRGHRRRARSRSSSCSPAPRFSCSNAL